MDSTNPSANFQPHIDQYTAKNAIMLSSVCSLVSPSSTNFALPSASSAMVLNFHSATPTGPILAARFPQTFLSASCLSRLSMRPATVRYSLDPAGSSGSAFSQAAFAPFQSPACPASFACCASESNSCACVSLPQDGQLSASDETPLPQFAQKVEVAVGTTTYSIDCGRTRLKAS